VINEWNGYYRFDRSDKITGLEELFPGMSLRDLHSPIYLSTGSDLCRDARPGETLRVPLFASFMTDTAPCAKLVLRTELHARDALGRERQWSRGGAELPFHPWLATALPDLKVPMPSIPCVAVLRLSLETPEGRVLHRNFTTFRVADGPAPRDELVKSEAGSARVLRFAPNSFREAHWSLKQWNVLDGLKVNGAGHGWFEYRLPWPAGLDVQKVGGAALVFEASAKELFAKDREGSTFQNVDYMRGEGTADQSRNPNSYPMTDTERHPSAVRVRVNGVTAGVFDLPDDPADHRGILSWHAQLRDRKLREAGSYGWLINAALPPAALEAAAQAGELVLRLEVDAALPGGLAVYGERFGRYAVEPALVLNFK